MLEALDACQLLDLGLSLTEQGRADPETGEVPMLLVDWMRAVRPVMEEVRAKKAKQAAEREQARQRR